MLKSTLGAITEYDSVNRVSGSETKFDERTLTTGYVYRSTDQNQVAIAVLSLAVFTFATTLKKRTKSK